MFVKISVVFVVAHIQNIQANSRMGQVSGTSRDATLWLAQCSKSKLVATATADVQSEFLGAWSWLSLFGGKKDASHVCGVTIFAIPTTELEANVLSSISVNNVATEDKLLPKQGKCKWLTEGHVYTFSCL